MKKIKQCIRASMDLINSLSGKKAASASLNLNYFRETFKNPRWGYGMPPHKHLYDIINRKRGDYKNLLEQFLDCREAYMKISAFEDEKKLQEPHLGNRWLPGLDSFALYSFIAAQRPEKYMEIGSGNSTKFARRSIKDHGLNTKVISIDPEPRAEIDGICDEVIRKPVEEVGLEIFDQLNSGDMLFVDNSHRCFMNSDVTTFFIDILPRLKPGVIVEIHDIFLPSDYPPDWGERYYSEQYLLAAYLLAEGNKFEILLPNAFIFGDPELNKIVEPVFGDEIWDSLHRGGGSFWIIIGKGNARENNP